VTAPRGGLLVRLAALEREVDRLPIDPEEQALIVAGLKAAVAGEEATPAQVLAVERWRLGRDPEADAAIWAQLSVEELRALASRALPGEEEDGGATLSGDGGGLSAGRQPVRPLSAEVAGDVELKVARGTRRPDRNGDPEPMLTLHSLVHPHGEREDEVAFAAGFDGRGPHDRVWRSATFQGFDLDLPQADALASGVSQDKGPIDGRIERHMAQVHRRLGYLNACRAGRARRRNGGRSGSRVVLASGGRAAIVAGRKSQPQRRGSGCYE
jgi:hypothetical protein